MSNTRPSSPRSNASTPRGAPSDDFDDLDLGLLRSLPNTPRPGTPRPGTPRPGTPSPPLRGGNGKSTTRKGKQNRRHTKQRIHRKVSNRRARQYSRLRH